MVPPMCCCSCILAHVLREWHEASSSTCSACCPAQSAGLGLHAEKPRFRQKQQASRPAGGCEQHLAQHVHGVGGHEGGLQVLIYSLGIQPLQGQAHCERRARVAGVILPPGTCSALRIAMHQKSAAWPVSSRKWAPAWHARGGICMVLRTTCLPAAHLVSDVDVVDGHLQVAQNGVHDGLQPACRRWLALAVTLILALQQDAC